MRLIDADLLCGKIAAMQACEPKFAYNFLNDAQNPSTEWGCIEDMIESIPIIEAKMAVHGYWIDVPNGRQKRWKEKCSVCGEYTRGKYPYCKYCGSKMDGDANA